MASPILWGRCLAEWGTADTTCNSVHALTLHCVSSGSAISVFDTRLTRNTCFVAQKLLCSHQTPVIHSSYGTLCLSHQPSTLLCVKPWLSSSTPNSNAGQLPMHQYLLGKSILSTHTDLQQTDCCTQAGSEVIIQSHPCGSPCVTIRNPWAPAAMQAGL